MSTVENGSVIEKKARSGREQSKAHVMSWSKAIRLALERSSDRLVNLPLIVRSVEEVTVDLENLGDQAGGDRLIMLLERQGHGEEGQVRPGRDAERGAAILDRALVQTLVEVQTRGHVTEA